MTSRRIERVNQLLQTELGQLLTHTLRDPRLSGLTSITEVQTSPDLRHARVYVSVLGNDEDKASTLRALQAAAGFLRHELATRLTMRHVPDLTFRIDDSIARGERIRELLRHTGDPPATSE